jgi:hypothetical protein
VTATGWIAAAALWGHPGGLAVGLEPADGPRGLIRVYAPYLGHGPGRVVNFIAIEPRVGGARGYSELESSPADGGPGLVITAGPPIATRDRLAVQFRIERFANGARPVVTAVFDRRRPREVEFTVSASAGSAPMDACILTATMGNYARLRRLALRGGRADAAALWAGAAADPYGFLPHREWPAARLPRDGGSVVLAAEPDEADPGAAPCDPAVDPWWRWTGRRARQLWRAPPARGLVGRVNARTTYYGTAAPIPGGTAFENLEFEAPYRPGQAFAFRVEPLPDEGHR